MKALLRRVSRVCLTQRILGKLRRASPAFLWSPVLASYAALCSVKAGLSNLLQTTNHVVFVLQKFFLMSLWMVSNMSLLLVQCHLFSFFRTNFLIWCSLWHFPSRCGRVGPQIFVRKLKTQPCLSHPVSSRSVDLFLFLSRLCWTCHSNMVVPCRDFPTACWKNVGGDIDANRFLFGDHVRSLSVQSHWSRSDFVRIFSDERFLNERFLGTCYLGDQRCLFPLWGFGVAVRMTRSNKLSLFEKDESLIA